MIKLVSLFFQRYMKILYVYPGSGERNPRNLWGKSAKTATVQFTVPSATLFLKKRGQNTIFGYVKINVYLHGTINILNIVYY
jgi:hypothetical protein